MLRLFYDTNTNRRLSKRPAAVCQKGALLWWYSISVIEHCYCPCCRYAVVLVTNLTISLRRTPCLLTEAGPIATPGATECEILASNTVPVHVPATPRPPLGTPHPPC